MGGDKASFNGDGRVAVVSRTHPPTRLWGAGTRRHLSTFNHNVLSRNSSHALQTCSRKDPCPLGISASGQRRLFQILILPVNGRDLAKSLRRSMAHMALKGDSPGHGGRHGHESEAYRNDLIGAPSNAIEWWTWTWIGVAAQLERNQRMMRLSPAAKRSTGGASATEVIDTPLLPQ